MNCVREDMNIETAERGSIDKDTKVLQPLDSGLPCSAAVSRGWTNGQGCGKITCITSAYCLVEIGLTVHLTGERGEDGPR